MTSKMTKSRIFTSLVLAFLAMASSADAHGGKCELLSYFDDRSIVYSCVQVTIDDLQSVPSETEWLQLTVSKLPDIPKAAFSRFNLRKLSLYNCAVRRIDPEAFKGLVNLRWLVFYGLTIPVVMESWFKDLKSLTHLSMENNHIMYIQPTVFLHIRHLEYLNIRNNELNCLSKHALARLRNLRQVRTRENPWFCNCYTELLNWIKHREIYMGEEDTVSKLEYECMEDFGPRSDISEAYKYQWKSLSSETSSTSQTEYVILNSAELARIPDNTESINFENTNIRMIRDFAFFRFGNNLRSLNFSNCNISQIEPEAFVGLSNLEQLILFNSSISTIKSEWFEDLYGLEELVLDGNSITHIPQGLFPWLGNVKTLSLDGNKIQCLSTDSFSILKNLKKVNVDHNPWVCSCQKEFRAWLDKKQIGYKMSIGKCTNAAIEKTQHRFETKYEDSASEYEMGNVITEIKNQTAESTHTSVHHSTEGFPTHSGNYHEDQNEEIAKIEAHHEQSKEITSYKQYINITKWQQQQQLHNITKWQQQQQLHNITKWQQQQLHSSVGCSAFQTDTNSVTGIMRKDERRPFKNCGIVDSPSLFVKKSYLCSHAEFSDIGKIPENTASIIFQNSVLTELRDETFSRFGCTLRILILTNCGIQHIRPRAFAGLRDLQQLNLNGNNIKVVQETWFKVMPSLRWLSLSCNRIDQVENGVFFHLKNLEYFEIRNNRLNSIATDSVYSMTSLRTVAIDNNPWSCLILRKLLDWMNTRRINYDESRLKMKSGTGTAWICIEFPLPPCNQNCNTTSETPEITSTLSPTRSPRPPGPRLCIYKAESQYGNNNCECVGGDQHVLDEIPNIAERIKITNAVIPRLQADAFSRFTNLKELLFYNCSIEDIDGLAFRGLRKLKSLIFVDNRILIVRSKWFQEITSLTKLQLARNSVTEIEVDVFKYLTNLEELSLQDNNITCIYTKSLRPLTSLKIVSFQENPWKWKCLTALEDFFQRRNISTTKFDTYQGKDITCGSMCNGIGAPSALTHCSGTTNTSISTVNVICVSIAMLIFTKF